MPNRGRSGFNSVGHLLADSMRTYRGYGETFDGYPILIAHGDQICKCVGITLLVGPGAMR